MQPAEIHIGTNRIKTLFSSKGQQIWAFGHPISEPPKPWAVPEQLKSM